MSHAQFKIIVLLFILSILYSLFRGLYFLVTRKEDGKGTARMLSWRIGLSVGLFALLIGLKLSGIVEPHALNEIPKSAAKNDIHPDEETSDKKEKGMTLEEIQNSSQASDGRIRLAQ